MPYAVLEVDWHGSPFCWLGLMSSFNWISIVRPSIEWLFLNRSSILSRIFVLLSSTVMFRIMFVFRLPCNPISISSNQSGPTFVSLFSVRRLGYITLLFSVLTSTSASPLNFIGFLLTSTKHFVVTVSFFWIVIGGIMVIGIQYQWWLLLALLPPKGLFCRSLSG